MKRSAGLLPYRLRDGAIEVFLVHPGGPFWARKDAGAWSVAKGALDDGEDPLAAARRELEEETSFAPTGEFLPLGDVTQLAGKVVVAWAVRSDFDLSRFRSNTFFMEWPPKSGKQQEFPEVDRAAWLALDEAREKILPAQLPFLDRLVELLARP